MRLELQNQPLATNIRNFLVVFVPLLAITLIVFSVFINVRRQNYIQDYLQTSENTIASIVSDFEKRLDHYISILFITGNTLENTRRAGQHNDDLTLSIMRDILQSTPELFQMRLIDADGMEVVRLDNREGIISVTGFSELQDKSGRYYVTDAYALGPNQVYISPIDLNVEHGKIEDPWVPTVRLATQLRYSSGLQELLIVNVNLSDMLALFSPANVSERSVLLNEEGFVLAGDEDRKLWGFMFEDGYNFAEDDDPLWETITGDSAGYYIRRETLYRFVHLDSHGDFLPGQSFYSGASKVKWIILISQDIPHEIQGRLGGDTFVLVLLLAMEAVIALLISTIVSARRIAMTAAKNETAALAKAERLSSMSRLVAGIAHELNTPIGSAITMSSAMFEENARFSRSISEGKILKSQIDNYTNLIAESSRLIQEGLERSADLIQNFKNVSIDQTSQRFRTFTLPDYLYEVLETIKPSIKEKRIHFDISCEQRVELTSYPGAFAQLITNLVMNSVIHGFKDRDSGHISLQLKAEADKLSTVYRDNGCGIAEQNLEKIFDPFFTTTSEIGGSGLGLNICFNIVQDLFGGQITVCSIVGQFTEFRITIPLEQQNPESIHG